MFFLKTKFLMIASIISLLAIMVLAVPSDDWDCYTTAEGWCKCEKSSTGGEGVCTGTYGDPNDPLVFTTFDRQTSPIVPQCMAVVDCLTGGHEYCVGLNTCETYYDGDGVAECDGMLSWC